MCIGFVMDMIFGDPCRNFHPIRILGRLIDRLEERFYHSFSRLGERIGRYGDIRPFPDDSDIALSALYELSALFSGRCPV